MSRQDRPEADGDGQSARMTLGEWLDAMSDQDRRRSSRAPRREDSRGDDILNAALAELEARDRATGRGEAGTHGRRQAARDAQPRATGGDRLDAALDQIERRLGDIATRIDERLQSRPDAAAATDLDARLADIARRIDEAHAARRPDAQEQGRLARLESSLEGLVKRLDERPPEGPQASNGPQAFNGPRRRMRPTASAIAEIRAHQLHLEDPAAPAPAPAADLLGDRLAAIADRLETAQARSLQALTPVVDTMRSDIAALAAKIGRSQPAPDLAPMREQLESLQQAIIGAIAKRPEIEAVRHEIALLARRLEQPRAEYAPMREQLEALKAALVGAIAQRPDMEVVRSEIAALAHRIEQPRADIDLSTIENQIASLSAKLETPPAPVADLGALERQMAELREAVTSAVRQPLPSDPTRLLDGLESRIDAAGGRISNDVRSQIQSAIIELRQALETRVAGQTIEAVTQAMGESGRPEAGTLGRLEQHLSALVGRFERMDSDPAIDNGQLERLAEEIRGMARHLDPAPAVAKLESRIEALDAKLDHVRAQPLLVQGKAGAKVAADLSGIESMIRGLTERMKEAQADQNGPQQFEELQAQIRMVAEKLDRADGAQSLSSIERTVSDLFAQIDAMRHESHISTEAVARQAAASAAREAADDVLRRAAADLAASAGGPRLDALADDVGALRRSSELIDRKTHETLDAIHLALEKIVERIGVVERDLAAAPALVERLAPEPAPVSPPRREEPPVIPAIPARESADVAIEAESAAGRLTGRRRPAAPAGAAATKSRFAFKLPFLSREAAGAAKTAAEPAVAKAETATTAPDRAPSLDLPLEPGSGRPTLSTRSAETAGTKANFIAAARRAAQMATEESAAARAAADAPVATGEKPKSLLETRKKPILIGLAALLLAVIAMNVLTRSSDAPDAPGKTEQKISMIAPIAPAPAPALPPLVATPAPAPAVTAPALIDPAPTGSIPSLGETAPTPAPAPPMQPAATDLPGAIFSPTLRAAALRGDPAAAYEVGVRLIDGRGVARDPKLALKWFERAAAEGLAPAQFRVGNMYEKGVGVARDARTARQWYQKAAEKGNAKALHNLGVLIAEGGDGKPDYAAAADYFMKAAKLGVRDSQYNIAILQARGLGVGQSMGEAYTWLSIAAAQGDEEAAKKRDEIGPRLSPDELSAAKAAAQAFKPQPNDKFANDVAGPEKGWDAPANAASISPARPKAKSDPKGDGARI